MNSPFCFSIVENALFVERIDSRTARALAYVRAFALSILPKLGFRPPKVEGCRGVSFFLHRDERRGVESLQVKALAVVVPFSLKVRMGFNDGYTSPP